MTTEAEATTNEEDTETQNLIIEKLKSQFGEDLCSAYESYGMTTVVVNKDRISEIMKFLKEDPQLNFHFLTDECGIHYPNNTDQELGMVYHLHNFMTNTRLRVETFFSSENPVIDSMTPLWASANWMERETYDFYGIIFEGHPDLKRILNMDEMDYFPMLKQYPLEDGTREDKNDKMFGR
jgi:NADH-quinone oxidoreductase subunit C